ncbi:tetratricopeptide repeat protein [Candidatus Similichlamydia laticola]|uniref:Uncharacterized protein n=1 Tax=Candidatus Similichlamydia laticola TaxID=2170265 RepID=A0A369KDY4_9BACT|nr:HrpB1 family type III secretion system apparatus protein [Candidatus Similichlamydia laticola]RDB31812.1 hypothetical protein HAT2_00079 [Candidatus Similichlamydia laticola]
MLEDILSICREDLHLFLEAGIMLTERQRDAEAEKLITSAKILAPDSIVPDLCFGHFAMQRMQFSAAICVLNRVLKKEPEHPLAMAMVGLCLAFSPQTQKVGREMLESVQEKTDDRDVLRMCEMASAWIKTDNRFKKSKSILIPGSEK